jgi:serine/threonine-protein kinase
MSILNTTIHGYRITDFMGSGGFGSVYKAEKKGRNYAIKIFREEYVLKEFRENGTQNRIEREIAVMKSVNHPNLVQYVDDFKGHVLNDPSYFLVMEFVDGRTLQTFIEEKCLSEKEVKQVFSQVLQGIQALHTVRGEEDDKGIIHRDLKPQNILVSTDLASVKIIDYGLSKVIDYTSITTTGALMGSPVYMSPEQVKDSKYIDKRSDLYTLGVILYQMLTGKLPYEFSTLPDLYHKILSGNPVPPRRWKPSLENRMENIILRLLEKEPYKRFATVNELIEEFNNDSYKVSRKEYDLDPKFFLRLYNEKSVLEEFTEGVSDPIYVEFPANHQTLQKGLLKLVQKPPFVTLIDPATMRLAYPAQGDVKGLQALPYAPPQFTVITPQYLQSQEKQREYVQKVLDEQVKLGASMLVAPYHYLHNTNVPASRLRNPVDEWFDLDIKLLKESIDYKVSMPAYHDKPLLAGICLNGDSLADAAHTTDLLNLFSAFECDGFFIYVDCIDHDTPASTLYHYIKTLASLQQTTGKPVIAGRVNAIGMGLLCAGISGFSSGAARFDSFYEGLYKEETDAYNLYERYYVPSLLATVSVDRRSPVKLGLIIKTIGSCDCYHCYGKSYVDLVQTKTAKLHFLDVVHREVETIKKLPAKKRIPYFLEKIDVALEAFGKLGLVFKPADYQHLQTWKEVFGKLNKELY